MLAASDAGHPARPNESYIIGIEKKAARELYGYELIDDISVVIRPGDMSINGLDDIMAIEVRSRQCPFIQKYIFHIRSEFITEPLAEMIILVSSQEVPFEA